MELLRTIPIWLYLIGVVVEGSDLPKLPHNDLLVGKDQYLPNSKPLLCGLLDLISGTVSKSQTPSQVLTPNNFGKCAFTAGPLSAPKSPSVTENSTNFSFAEITVAKKTVYGLQVDPSGEHAYWLFQGGVIDIPKRPTGNQPKYVFTPDFSGCSWTVTPTNKDTFRLRHVDGGKELQQFNSLSEAEKGGPTTYAMQYMDYGYIVETKQLLESVRAYAYMHFDGTRWTLYLQRHTCAPETAGAYEFDARRLLKKADLLNPKKTTYKPITSTKAYTIPFQ